MKKLYWPWNRFQFFNMTNFANFFYKTLVESQKPWNLLHGLTIFYCMVSKCYGMFFKFSTPRILAFLFLQNMQFFRHFLYLIRFFNRKSPLGFDNKLLENVFWPWINFQLLLSQVLAVSYAICNFQVLKFLSIFRFLQPQEQITSSKV